MKYVYSTCPCGQIKGIGAGDYRLFKGIRYARANRWEAPEEVTNWEGVYDATAPGALCPQYDAYITKRPPVKQFYYDETVEKEGASYSEDCLYLNIWTPADAQNAPVLMYIHGGSYETGAGSKASFQGMNYCRRGVIVVTINYRLNAFSSAVGDGIKSNFGLRDQVCALQWIRHNIAAFGGDPEKVTIMGESAGAMSVQNLIFTPLAKGLFQGAVMLSGAGILPEAFRIKAPQDAEELWIRVREALGVDSMEALKNVPAEQVFRTWQSIHPTDRRFAQPTTPVIDGETIPATPRQLAEEGRVNGVPTIAAVLSEDMWPRTLYRTVLEWAELMEAAEMPPVYGLYMDRPVPGSDFGAYHGCDVRYAFGTFESSWRPYETVDYRISANMMDYIAGFVKTGIPAAQGLPEWTPLQGKNRRFMHFGNEPCAMVEVPEDRLEAFQKKGKPFPGM